MSKTLLVNTYIVQVPAASWKTKAAKSPRFLHDHYENKIVFDPSCKASLLDFMKIFKPIPKSTNSSPHARPYRMDLGNTWFSLQK